MKSGVWAFFACIFVSYNALAAMQQYSDDEEFNQCVRVVGDIDRCIKDEYKRVMTDVKKLYKEILTQKALSNFNANMEENVAFMRDMYTSWTAFRNRICSLAEVSVTYLGSWRSEELACNNYYAMHHREHLQSIRNLLKRNPEDKFPPVSKLDFVIIDDHDEEYGKCMLKENAVEDKCLDEEFKRSTKRIKDLYNTLNTSEYTKEWNNGPDLKKGNYRDMFDSWVAYRNRICSLTVFAFHKGLGKDSMSRIRCLQFFNMEKNEALDSIYLAANSALDEEYMEEDYGDGGKEIGQKITPLQSRPQNTESLVTDNTAGLTSDNKADNQKKTPSWAK